MLYVASDMSTRRQCNNVNIVIVLICMYMCVCVCDVLIYHIIFSLETVEQLKMFHKILSLFFNS